MKPLYSRIRTKDSFCPECGEPAMLLSSDYTCLPAFYICIGGGCGWVGQVGVGLVPDVISTDEDDEDDADGEEVPG